MALSLEEIQVSTVPETGDEDELCTNYYKSWYQKHYILTKKDLSQEWPNGSDKSQSVNVAEYMNRLTEKKDFNRAEKYLLETTTMLITPS